MTNQVRFKENRTFLSGCNFSTICDGMLMYTERVVIPCSLEKNKKKILIEFHSGHPRMSRMKSYMGSNKFWPSRNRLIGLVGRVFANGPGDLGSIPGRVRLLKWYLKPPCLTLSNIRYVSRVKWNNPRKGVVAIEKGAFLSPSTTVTNLLMDKDIEKTNKLEGVLGQLSHTQLKSNSWLKDTPWSRLHNNFAGPLNESDYSVMNNSFSK